MSDEDVSSVAEVEPLLLPKDDIEHSEDIICPSSSPQTPNKERSQTNSQSSTDELLIV
jgi:hypothetical protein